MRWQADATPRYNLSLKYLRKILTKKELTDLIRRYCEAKRATITERLERSQKKP